jgi:hypothetical protein
MDASITCHETRRVSKNLLVMLYRLGGLPMLVGVI